MASRRTAQSAPAPSFSRRERQVMDILHRRGEATVAEIMNELPDPPTYSAVRVGVAHTRGEGCDSPQGRRPALRLLRRRDRPKQRARTFSHTSSELTSRDLPEQAVTALLRMSDTDMTEDDVQRHRETIRRARQEGR